MSTTHKWPAEDGFLITVYTGPAHLEARVCAALVLERSGVELLAAHGHNQAEALYRLAMKVHDLQAFIFVQSIAAARAEDA